ncbi:MAG: type II toxin-antitoxin system RelE/ParE family toxin [Acetobacteraceae bacterium]|nr:type II toxin-antitoxin system RelE/ParE family toxin [Acetobacteraceae bacterium]
MTKRLVYSGQARIDLEEIFSFIAADNPTRAGTYVADIEAACEKLSDTPMIGMARPDLRPDLRIVTFRRRVVIAYRVLPDHLEILRVFTGGRDYETIMGSD